MFAWIILEAIGLGSLEPLGLGSLEPLGVDSLGADLEASQLRVSLLESWSGLLYTMRVEIELHDSWQILGNLALPWLV